MIPHTQGQLVWTSDKPQEEGWWWRWQEEDFPEVVRIKAKNKHGPLGRYDAFGWEPLNGTAWKILWAGPIPLPVEPKDGGG